MDDYLSKPFSEAQLAAVVGRWAAQTRVIVPAPGPSPLDQPAAATADVAAPPAPATALADIDEAVLAQMQVARPHLLSRLLTAYLSHSPGVVGELTRAVNDGNVAALKLAAHSLKSSSANVGARRVAALARELEALAQARNIAEATAVAEALRTEFAAVQGVLDEKLRSTTGVGHA
jgi:HPt (histidine-containing phosphotransfer) domain-containing protein